ncbi:hypothetical protein T439DRAFT_379041 [Meredithblackwellia eburnea MCA 4105]
MSRAGSGASSSAALAGSVPPPRDSSTRRSQWDQPSSRPHQSSSSSSNPHPSSSSSSSSWRAIGSSEPSQSTSSASLSSRPSHLPPPPADYFKPNARASSESSHFAPRAVKKPRLSNGDESYSSSGFGDRKPSSSSHASTSTGSKVSVAYNQVSAVAKAQASASGFGGPSSNVHTRRPSDADTRPNGSSPSSSTSKPLDPDRRQESVAEKSAPPLREPAVKPIRPAGARDYFVLYDPVLDKSPVKKGKELVYRYNGDGIVERPTDPRKSSSPAVVERLAKIKSRAKHARSLTSVTYQWDSNSTAPPPPAPPATIMVSGFLSSTTSDEIKRHFHHYGRIEHMEIKIDKATGGSLGICTIQFVDDMPRRPDADKLTKDKYERDRRKGAAQDGNAVALEAIAKSNGSKIGARMMMQGVGVKVEMDDGGKKAELAAAAEYKRRHAPPPPPKVDPPPPPPPVAASTSAPPSSSSTSRPPAHASLPPRPVSSYSSERSPPNGQLPTPQSDQAATMGPYLARQFEQTQKNMLLRQEEDRQRRERREQRLKERSGATDVPPSSSSSATPQPPSTAPPPPPSTAPPPPPSLPPPPPPADPPAPSSSFPSSSSLPRPPPGIGLPARPVTRFDPPSGPRGSRGAPASAKGASSRQDPYKPVVFSGPPSNSTRPGAHGFRTSPGKGSSMQAAVQAAVELAKKRLAHKKRGDGGGEVDMEIDSEQETASKDMVSDSEDEDKLGKVDQVFFHGSRRGPQVVDGRRILMRGEAPAAAIAWQASPQVLREKLIANGHPYISISKSSFLDARSAGSRTANLNGQELENFFAEFKLDRTFADREGWYVTFTDSKTAKKAFEDLNGRRFAGAPIELTFNESPTSQAASARQEVESALKVIANLNLTRAKKLSGWSDGELVEEARDIVIRDLMDTFKNDIRTRLISTKVLEHLGAADLKMAEKQSSPVKAEASTLIDIGSSVSALPKASAGAPLSLKNLPSFARRKPPLSANQHRQDETRKRPVSRRMSSEAPSDSPELEGIRGSKNLRTHESPALVRKKARIADSESDSDSDAAKPPPPRPTYTSKPKSKKIKRPVLDYTSSEDEASDSPAPTVTVTAPLLPAPPVVEVTIETLERAPVADLQKEPEPAMLDVPSPKKKRAPSKKKAKEKEVAVTEEIEGEDIQMVVEEVGSLPTPAATEASTTTIRASSLAPDSDRDKGKGKQKISKGSKASPVTPTKSRSLTPDPFAQGIAADEEDLFYVKLALQRLRRGAALHPTPPPSEDEDSDAEPPPPPRHPSGCARTEGFYKLSAAEKLANRPTSNKARSTIESASASGVAVSRLARANTRGLVRGMELHKKVTATDTDVLKFNQLRTRKKQLTFARSGIEGYGLFAAEPIPAGEMVIEYVGELIRQQVADRREKAYERQGIGSSYLFRVDEDLVVDATKKGNLGRLINHCCAPNCTAKIITINGEKKIVIYAKTNINPGEEVTYDYHFPHEEVKIPCLCGHPLCRLYLN